MMINKKHIFTLALLLMCLIPLKAQVWYVGAQGGIPIGESTFSSFGGKVGWSTGVYGGYRFNQLFSLETTFKMGQLNLVSRKCCIDNNMWLGSDRQPYHVPVLGMEGFPYWNLKTKSYFCHYGLQFNVNVFGFFNKTKYSRWTLELAPTVSAVSTNPTVRTLLTNDELYDATTSWHLGVGGKLQAGFSVTKLVTVGVYSDITFLLMGKRMDGIPEYGHKNNFIWDSGIKVGCKFGSLKRKKKTSGVAAPSPSAVQPPVDKPIIKEVVKVIHDTIYITKPVVEPKPVVVPQPTPIAKEEVKITFPSIYFGSNSRAIAPNELKKMQTIKQHLLDNPKMKITVIGWCDKTGTKEANARVSLRRAEVVKTWLTTNGIAPSRVVTRGNGSDFNEPDANKARRADVTIIE